MKKKNRFIYLLFSSIIILGSCVSDKQETFYEQHLTFPEGATIEEKVNLAAHLTPSAKQLAWQKLELTAFIHFGMNTFTGKEWGDGKEDPALFNPSNLDTDQWVRTLKEAGFKLAILTAKHHDGFCLWPTKTTQHSVVSSPWRGGKGDVVADFVASCHKYGIKIGLYLSPWDRNHPTYGMGDEYNAVYVEQLRELLGNYGKVDEVWFDGANGEGANGKKQAYDWGTILATIKELQPDAVTAIMGSDVRWVGNEKGLGRDTEWSASVLKPIALATLKNEKQLDGITETSEDLGSRDLLARAKELYWYPSEVDVSIRKGWFYHPEETPKSLSELKDIYFSSVGMNSNLLLNIPPDTNGGFDEKDVKRLQEFGDFVRSFYDHTVGGGAYYRADDKGEITVKLPKMTTFDTILLQEDIAFGQRVESFHVEIQDVNGEWTSIATATTIGHKRILLLPEPVTAREVRITITQSRAMVLSLYLSLHLRP